MVTIIINRCPNVKILIVIKAQEVDCTDCVLTAGLVDLHTHLYQYATPLGIDPAICLARSDRFLVVLVQSYLRAASKEIELSSSPCHHGEVIMKS